MNSPTNLTILCGKRRPWTCRSMHNNAVKNSLATTIHTKALLKSSFNIDDKNKTVPFKTQDVVCRICIPYHFLLDVSNTVLLFES